MLRFVRCAALMLCCMLPLTAFAANCPAARKVGEDYVCQPVYDVAAGDAAFADAMLIGDSIAGSIADYNAFPALEVEAAIGISPVHAHKSRIIRIGDRYYSLYQLALEAEPEKLYLMLGSNGLCYKTAETVLPDYHALLDDLIRNLPDTEIYLLSVTPVASWAKKETPRLTTSNINAFNQGLLDLAKSHGVYYIDLSRDLMNAGKTAIQDDYVAGDGVHLTREGIAVVVKTLRLHTNR